MRLSPAQINLLDLIVKETIISRGPRKGKLKACVNPDCYDARSWNGLIQKELIRWHFGIFGNGLVATAAGVELNSRNPS